MQHHAFLARQPVAHVRYSGCIVHAAFYRLEKRLVSNLDLAHHHGAGVDHRAGAGTAGHCRASASRTSRRGTPGRHTSWTVGELEKADWQTWLSRENELFARSRRADARRARAGRTRSFESLLRGQPGLPRALRTQLEPFVRPAARGPAQGRSGPAAWTLGLTLFAATRGADLRCSRLCRGRFEASRTRHGARGPGVGALARLAGRDPARGPRSAATRGARASPSTSSATRMAARWPCSTRPMLREDSTLACSQPGGAVFTHDRPDALRALRRHCRLAGAAAAILEVGLAGDRSRIQSFQVQLVSGQRGAPVLRAHAGTQRAVRRARGKRRTRAPPAGAGLPVRGGFDRASAMRWSHGCSTNYRRMAARSWYST